MTERIPDSASEAQLQQLRRDAEHRGLARVPGPPTGAPFPTANPDVGYYGLPLLKKPVWSWEAPVYLFVGGAAGVTAIIGAMAGNRDEEHATLRRHARWLAAAGGPISAVLLTVELGRPERFINMLRVFKVRSPMSMGSWILTAFSAATASALIAELMRAPTDGRGLRAIDTTTAGLSAVTGSLLATYTGVLIGSTAIPAWNKHARELPVLFGAAGLASAVSLLELLGHRLPSLNRLAIAAAATESVIDARIEMEHSATAAAFKRHHTAALTRVGGILSGPVPLILRLAGRTLASRRLAALAALGGSLITRLAWFSAGRASANDPAPALELPQPDRVH